ncbi:aldehyde dehydrogenase family protein [bacterium]|nr:MAG: aldehyde dehydrogenase family protein [bacterium]
MIGGTPTQSGETFPVFDPSRSVELARCTQGTSSDVDAAVRAARDAQPGWAGRTGHERARHLYALARMVQRHARLFAVLETLNNGKPIRESRDLDIPLVARHFYHHAGWAQVRDRELPGAEPVGVCAGIVPWNFPLLMLAWKVAPALAMGNTVVLKPAEQTPLTALLFAELAHKAGLPAGVLNVVTGDGETGAALAAHPDIAKVAFTGSTEIGKLLRQQTAGSGKRLTLELGGKSPFVVDETADLKKTAEILAWAKYFNNGQTCIAPDYLLVHESVKTPLLNEIKAVVERMYGTDAAARATSDSYARIVNQRHFQRVKGLIDDAARRGATVLMGGRTNESDNFIEPTLIDGVTDEMQIMQEEIFGPLLPVVSVKNLDDALAHINSREKPLALYIHSKKQANIDYLINRTSAGDTVINDAMIHFTNPEMPFGGINNSGIGSYHGYFGFQELSHRRSILRRQFGTMKFLFPPYTDRVKKLISWAVRFS